MVFDLTDRLLHRLDGLAQSGLFEFRSRPLECVVDGIHRVIQRVLFPLVSFDLAKNKVTV
jgi:hypothetical protein